MQECCSCKIVVADQLFVEKDKFLPRNSWLGSRGLVTTAEMIVGWIAVWVVHHLCLSCRSRRLHVCRLLLRRFLFVVFEILVIILKLLVFVSIIVVLPVA